MDHPTAPRSPGQGAPFGDQGPRLRLLPPDDRGIPAPLGGGEADDDQAAALEAFAAGEDVLVHGAPGAGRTRVALTAAIAAASRGECVLIAPRRATADALRDAVARHGAGARVRAVTPAALAHALVRREAIARGRGEPSLVTGAEQDELLADLVASMTDWEVPLDPAALALPGFRAQLREVLTRAGELGLLPADLERLAARRGRPAWADAARVQRRYLDVLDLQASAALDAGPRLDSGRLVREGARVAREGGTAPFSAIVVDDAQDLTAAGVDLVRALAGHGAPLMVTTCPDEVVDSFRGAVPEAADRILEGLRPSGGRARAGGGAATSILLRSSHRTPAGARRVIEALRAHLPLAGAPNASRRPTTQTAAGAVGVLRAPGPVEEARRIAGVLRDLHHARGIAYDDMAIVCRSGAILDEVADRLQREGLPVTASGRPRPLREEPVVTDLLRIVEIALTGAVPGGEEAATLLRGPFGDADALRLRRIRRLLLAARRGQDEGSADLLARALVTDVPGLPGADERDRAAAPVHRIRRMVRAVRALPETASGHEVLWAAWDAAQVAAGWRWAALETDDLDVAGARGRLADRRLDAVTTLFALADRHLDQRPESGALGLIEHVRATAVAEDTLAARARPAGRIRVVTPAQIAGSQVRVVVLAHVQEGSWPDVRLRSSLFALAELQLAAVDPELPASPGALRAIQREQVVADEVRLAVSALARARDLVLVTAVEDEDESPSALVDVIEQAAGESWVDPALLEADPGPAPDARRLVAALRRRLTDGDQSPERRRSAASLLARLGEAGAPGADPRTWYHQGATSIRALREEGEVLRLSPSALERARDCPQAWLLERAGGSPAPGPQQSIGTAVHRLAQMHPAGIGCSEGSEHPADRAAAASAEESAEGPGTTALIAELHRMLAPLHLERAWSTRRILGRAEDTVRLLADHLAVTGMPLAVEAPFAVDEDGVQLRGSIDRIEGDGTGLRVVDLKTGRAPKSAADAAVDPQLGAYQTAVRSGGLADVLGPDAPQRLGGAQLVYLGTGASRPAVRVQGAFETADHPEWFRDLLREVRDDVSGASVAARPNRHCDRCPVRRTCPVWPEGEEL